MAMHNLTEFESIDEFIRPTHALVVLQPQLAHVCVCAIVCVCVCVCACHSDSLGDQQIFVGNNLGGSRVIEMISPSPNLQGPLEGPPPPPPQVNAVRRASTAAAAAARHHHTCVNHPESFYRTTSGSCYGSFASLPLGLPAALPRSMGAMREPLFQRATFPPIAQP